MLRYHVTKRGETPTHTQLTLVIRDSGDKITLGGRNFDLEKGTSLPILKTAIKNVEKSIIDNVPMEVRIRLILQGEI